MKKKPLFSPLSLGSLAAAVLIYLVLWATGVPQFSDALESAWGIFLQVVPVLVVVVLFMTGANLVPNAFVKQHMGVESGFKGYIVAVIAGTLSHGPVYAWYPFLSELREKGVSNGKLAAFLYARAIKIPLLAAMVFYFGISFTILFSIVILVGAFVLGFLFERIS